MKNKKHLFWKNKDVYQYATSLFIYLVIFLIIKDYLEQLLYVLLLLFCLNSTLEFSILSFTFLIQKSLNSSVL